MKDSKQYKNTQNNDIAGINELWINVLQIIMLITIVLLGIILYSYTDRISWLIITCLLDAVFISWRCV